VITDCRWDAGSWQCMVTTHAHACKGRCCKSPASNSCPPEGRSAPPTPTEKRPLDDRQTPVSSHTSAPPIRLLLRDELPRVLADELVLSRTGAKERSPPRHRRQPHDHALVLAQAQAHVVALHASLGSADAGGQALAAQVWVALSACACRSRSGAQRADVHTKGHCCLSRMPAVPPSAILSECALTHMPQSAARQSSLGVLSCTGRTCTGRVCCPHGWSCRWRWGRPPKGGGARTGCKAGARLRSAARASLAVAAGEAHVAAGSARAELLAEVFVFEAGAGGAALAHARARPESRPRLALAVVEPLVGHLHGAKSVKQNKAGRCTQIGSKPGP
jgi:hypothetical protein